MSDVVMIDLSSEDSLKAAAAQQLTKQVKIPVVPWRKKHTPTTLDDIKSQPEVVQLLKSMLDAGKVPNMFFYGPPSSGKATVARALARELYGDSYQRQIYDMSVRDDSTTSLLLGPLKAFASTRSLFASKDHRTSQKLIVLRHCECLSTEQLQVLKRLLQRLSSKVMFILCSTELLAVRQPFALRQVFFPTPTHEHVFATLGGIITEEQVNISPSSLITLIEKANGNIDNAIIALHSYHVGRRAVTEEEMTRIRRDNIPDSFFEGVFATMLSDRAYNEQLDFFIKCVETSALHPLSFVMKFADMLPMLFDDVESPEYYLIEIARIEEVMRKAAHPTGPETRALVMMLCILGEEMRQKHRE